MIDKDKVYTYFDKLHGPMQKSSNGWYTGVCPICGHTKLAVHFEYLQAKCWRGCFKGFAMDLIMLHHDLTYFASKEMIEDFSPTYIRLPNMVSRGSGSDISLPPGYHSILSGNSSLGDRARKYLEGRGFDLNYLDRIGVGYCNEGHAEYNKNYLGYIIIPFKKNGELVYFIGRDFVGNKERYKNPANEMYGIGKSEVLFNEGALFTYDRVYVLEGWTDAVTIGAQGVSTQGADLSIYQRTKILESPVREVVVIPDIGFYAAGLITAETLYRYKEVKVLDLWPLRELGKDVNAIGRDAVFGLENNTTTVNKLSLYKAIKIEHSTPRIYET